MEWTLRVLQVSWLTLAGLFITGVAIDCYFQLSQAWKKACRDVDSRYSHKKEEKR